MLIDPFLGNSKSTFLVELDASWILTIHKEVYPLSKRFYPIQQLFADTFSLMIRRHKQRRKRIPVKAEKSLNRVVIRKNIRLRYRDVHFPHITHF